MSLDKDKILNELNSVMSQLQSADCGCMDKLFSNPNQNAGCGGGGGWCRRPPCAGGGGGGGGGCMGDGTGGGGMGSCMGGGMANGMGAGMGGGMGGAGMGAGMGGGMGGGGMGGGMGSSMGGGGMGCGSMGMGGGGMGGGGMGGGMGGGGIDGGMGNGGMGVGMGGGSMGAGMGGGMGGGGMGGGMGCGMGGGRTGGSCMPRCCNPVKMYTDTYNYLNANLMQPTIKEVMDDFKCMNDSNTVGMVHQGKASAGGAGSMNMPSVGGGGAPDMGIGAGNTNMGNLDGTRAGDSGMGMGNTNISNVGDAYMGDSSVSAGNANMCNVGGAYMGGSGMGAGNANMANSGGAGTGDMSMGGGRTNMAGMGMPTGNMNPSNDSNMGDHIMKMMNMSGGGKQSLGYSGDTRMQNTDPNLVPTSPHYGQSDPMAANYGHMSMGEGQNNQMHGEPNMDYPNLPTSSGQMAEQQIQHQMHGQPMTNQMRQNMQTGQGQMSRMNMPQRGMAGPNNPLQGNMHMGQGYTNQMNAPHGGIPVPKVMQADANAVPSNAPPVPQGNLGNAGAPSIRQGNMNARAPNQMRQSHLGRGNMMGNIMTNMLAPKGIKFDQITPTAAGGAESGDLGFDPMAIALQMNPANQKMAAINMMNQLMCGNRGFSNYMNNVMGIPPAQQLQQRPAVTQPPTAAGSVVDTSQPTDQTLSQEPQGSDPNAVPSHPSTAQVSETPGHLAGSREHAPETMASQPIYQEPIYPAVAMHPPSYRPSPRGQYEYNVFGQPIQLIPSERYHNKEPSLPQTLSPQAGPVKVSRTGSEQSRYAVKSTVSKTSIIPRRSSMRIPSRGQLALNRQTASNPGPQAIHPPQGGSHSDGRLNAAPQVQKHVPIEAISNVAGDATSSQQNTVPAKLEENKGLPEGTPIIAASGAMVKGKHNGLQDRNFVLCPNSSWSFGTPRSYSYHPAPIQAQRTIRSRRY